jgi:hypothetical protein
MEENAEDDFFVWRQFFRTHVELYYFLRTHVELYYFLFSTDQMVLLH